MIYFTSDTHFGHAKIIPYCKRPWETVAEMDEALIAHWNAIVEPGDTVYHLGDVAMKGAEYTRSCVERLNGKRVLVRGNHDPNVAKMLNRGFHEVYDRVCSTITRNAEGTKNVLVEMNHIPVNNELDSRGYVRQPTLPLYRDLIEKGELLYLPLCGHVHDLWKVKDGCVNVGVDVWHYQPISIMELLIFAKEQGIL